MKGQIHLPIDLDQLLESGKNNTTFLSGTDRLCCH